LAEQELKSGPKTVLALDTSSAKTGLALIQGQDALRSVTLESDQKRSEKLWSDIESVLSESAITISDIDIFGVCTGPGGFTGLRVGMSAMKGLAAATHKPLIGVTSLEAAASQASPASVVVALVNAHKGEVYSQSFSIDRDGMPIALEDPFVSTLSDALARAANNGHMVFAGDAAIENRELIETSSGNEIAREGFAGQAEGRRVLNNSSHSLAVEIARLSFLKHARSRSGDAESLRACYVRPAEAEVKLSLGLIGSKIKRSLKSG
jgi:tRNA threonylcarbamoyladenosine biosynthesis protein TsaB